MRNGQRWGPAVNRLIDAALKGIFSMFPAYFTIEIFDEKGLHDLILAANALSFYYSEIGYFDNFDVKIHDTFKQTDHHSSLRIGSTCTFPE